MGRRRIIPRAVSRPTTYDLLPGSQNRDVYRVGFCRGLSGVGRTTRALNACRATSTIRDVVRKAFLPRVRDSATAPAFWLSSFPHLAAVVANRLGGSPGEFVPGFWLGSRLSSYAGLNTGPAPVGQTSEHYKGNAIKGQNR